MKKVIFAAAGSTTTAIMTPAPLSRLVSSITFDGKTTSFDPIAPLDVALRSLSHKSVEGLSITYAETEDQFVDRIRAKDVPADATNVHVVDEADIPTDRTFRDAWRHDVNGALNIDMTSAVEIHKAKLRQARAPLLAALDADYAKADEAGDAAAKKKIAAKKQALRDVTKLPAIAAATTPDQLKDAWPSDLTPVATVAS